MQDKTPSAVAVVVAIIPVSFDTGADMVEPKPGKWERKSLQAA